MMKRIIAILIAIILSLTLVACSKQPTAQTDIESSEAVSSVQVEVVSDEKDNYDESDDSTTVHSEKPTVNSNPSSETEDSTVTQTTEKKTVETEAKPPVLTEATETQTAESVDTTKQAKESKQEVTETKPDTTVEITEPTKIETPSANEVEKKVIEYINEYRVAQGQSEAVVLNGLNNVAKYRAKQLVLNYAHIHPRTTCGELKYGKYVDLTAYGLPETDNYYEGFDKEALCKGDWYGTADQIANSIATGFKNSSVHWEYVGQSKYQYMGVGIYYDESTETWYGCICMSKENYGG